MLLILSTIFRITYETCNSSRSAADRSFNPVLWRGHVSKTAQSNRGYPKLAHYAHAFSKPEPRLRDTRQPRALSADRRAFGADAAPGRHSHQPEDQRLAQHYVPIEPAAAQDSGRHGDQDRPAAKPQAERCALESGWQPL